MIYLDTHVVVWLYAGDTKKLSETCIKLINTNDVFISPIVKLELQYLFEIKRITKSPEEIIFDLTKRIGLKVCPKPFTDVINQSVAQNWTRDPFDRIIVAQAELDANILLSKDKVILENYSYSKW